MTPACANCGAPLVEGARFCSACGAPADAPGPAREARKVVTALFADVVGSTALGERMDPEDFKNVVNEAVARMAIAVEEFGGEVLELAGDGLLALFGARVAHEDDPERAALAALRIVEGIERFSAEVARDWGIEGFAVRVGMETGLAVLGPVGGGGKVEYGAIGDVLNTAARLQAASEAGLVLVGSQTQRSIASLFEWGEPRALRLKGKAEPVIAYPLGPPAGAVAARPVKPALGIVGRDAELATGRAAVERVLAGSGGVVIVSGEAGIGKTRLVTELREQFEAGSGRDRPWLEGRCVSYGEGLPYWPFRLLFREWLAHSGASAPELRQALRLEAERLLGDRAPELVPLLEPVVGLAGDENARPESPGEEIQRRIQDAVCELLDGMANTGPLAVFLDDVHWADASSLALLERAFALAEANAVLFVLTTRPGPGQPHEALHQAARRRLGERLTEIRLEALGEETDRGLLGALVGDAELPAELERRLLARAEGNPLYLEELVRSLVDAGALVPSNGGLRFEREVPVELPETVEKVILARVDRLGTGAHEALAVASVLGRQFPVALLEQVMAKDPAEALTDLDRAGLLVEGPRLPAPSLAFKHTLIQEVTYGSLLKRRRQELHGRAVGAVKALYAQRIDEFLGMLAHHASAAGDARLALEFGRRAGDAAGRVHAVDEAIEQYAVALEAAERLGIEDGSVAGLRLERAKLMFDRGDADRARSELEETIAHSRKAGDREVEIDALSALATLWRTRDFARADELIEEAAELAERVRGPHRVDALARLSIQYANQLRFDRALEVGERALAVAREDAGGDNAEAVAMDALKLTALHTGDLERLEELTARLAAIFRQTPEEGYYLQWTLLESAFVPLGRGRWKEAIARIEEALALLRRRGRDMHEPLFVDALCWTHRSRGDYEGALAAGSKASAAGHRLVSREWAAWADATLGWTLLDARAPDAAAECLERGLETAEGIGAPAQLTRCACLLAWARAMQGEPKEAVGLAERGEELLARVTVPAGRAWLFGAHAYMAVARARLAAGDPERAAALAAPIAAAGARSGWREAEACASLVVGLAQAALGDSAGADRELGRAIAVAEAAGLPAPAWEAHAALAGLRDGAAGIEHGERARAILAELAAPLSDPKLREGLLASSPARP